MITPEPTSSQSDPFDELLNSVARPPGGGIGNIEIGEYAQTVEITEMESYGGITEEHVERSKVVRAARECFQLSGQPLIVEVDRLLEMLVHSPAAEVIQSEEYFETSPNAEVAGKFFRRSLIDFDESIVTAALVSLCKRDPQLQEHLSSRFLKSALMDSSFDVITATLASCSNTSETVNKRAFELLVSTFSSNGDDSPSSFRSSQLTELGRRKSELSLVEAHSLLGCAANFERDEFAFDYSLSYLQTAVTAIMKRFPQSVANACVETLESQTANASSITLACEALAEATPGAVHLNADPLSRLISSENPVIQTAAIQLCGNLGKEGLPFLYQIMEIADTDGRCSLSALKTLGNLGAVAEERRRVERFFEYIWRDLIEAIDGVPDDRVPLAPDGIVDPMEANNEEFILSRRNFRNPEVPPEMKLEACIEGIGALAPYSDAMLRLFFQAIEMPSPLVRNYVLRGLPKTGDLHKLEGVFARLLETSPISIDNLVVHTLVYHFNEDGIALLRDWFGVAGNMRDIHPILSQKQVQDGLETLEYWQKIKAASDRES